MKLPHKKNLFISILCLFAGYFVNDYYRVLFLKPIICFSPKGQCEDLVISAINSANKEILVQCYSFTAKNITNALIKASKRGITIKVLYDIGQARAPHSEISRLLEANIFAKPDKVSGLAHNKILIIDEKRLLTGSYNFSKAANLTNAENIIYLSDHKLAKIYKQQWLFRLKQSYTRRTKNKHL